MIIPDADAADAAAGVIMADVVYPCDVMYDASEDATSTVAEVSIEQQM